MWSHQHRTSRGSIGLRTLKTTLEKTPSWIYDFSAEEVDLLIGRELTDEEKDDGRLEAVGVDDGRIHYVMFGQGDAAEYTFGYAADGERVFDD